MVDDGILKRKKIIEILDGRTISNFRSFTKNYSYITSDNRLVLLLGSVYTVLNKRILCKGGASRFVSV
jgi:hypothetical protein